MQWTEKRVSLGPWKQVGFGQGGAGQGLSWGSQLQKQLSKGLDRADLAHPRSGLGKPSGSNCERPPPLTHVYLAPKLLPSPKCPKLLELKMPSKMLVICLQVSLQAPETRSSGLALTGS